MKTMALVGILIIFLVFCAFILYDGLWTGRTKKQPITSPQESPPTTTVEAHGFKIRQKPEDMPQFNRTYTKQLDERCRIDITIGKWSFGLKKNGELTQPNRNFVWFDPDRVADKIIDPLLVPLVQKAIDQIYAIDTAWRDADPDHFTDERGVKWRRYK